jgi:hypothetical protein
MSNGIVLMKLTYCEIIMIETNLNSGNMLREQRFRRKDYTCNQDLANLCDCSLQIFF